MLLYIDGCEMPKQHTQIKNTLTINLVFDLVSSKFPTRKWTTNVTFHVICYLQKV